MATINVTDFTAVSDGRTNLVTNPSFETNLTGWTQYVNGGSSTNPTLTQTNSQSKFGTYSMQVATNGTFTYSGVVINPTLVIGLTYTFSVWVLGTNGNDINIYVGQTNNPTFDGTLSGVWQQISITFVAQSTNPQIYIRTGTNGSTFYLDGAMLEANGNVGTYFDGSFPNANWTGTANASTSTTSSGFINQNVNLLIKVTDSTAVSDNPSVGYAPLYSEIPCSVSVSNYKYLTPTLLAAQQSTALRPYFRCQIVDDTVYPNQIISANNLGPFTNGSSVTAPDGRILAVGIDASGNLSFFQGSNLHSGAWDSITILEASGGTFLSPNNRYCISTSNWINGTYYVLISYFEGFVNTTANVAHKYWISKNGGQSFFINGSTSFGTPAMQSQWYGSGSVENYFLGMAPMAPRMVNGQMMGGWFFIAPNTTVLPYSRFQVYDIWYTFFNLSATTPSPTGAIKWSERYVNSGDWTLQSVDSTYANGKDYIAFSGFRNFIDTPNSIVTTSGAYTTALLTANTGIYVTALTQINQNANDGAVANMTDKADVWLPPRSLISSFGVGTSNVNSFNWVSITYINGKLNVICEATTVDSSDSSASENNITRNVNYMLMQSVDGINFSYPAIIVSNTGLQFTNNGSDAAASYVAQGQYLYLLGNGAVWEFIQNNVVADVTNSVIQYSIQDSAGQPSSINLQIANQNNLWVGSSPTAPGAAAISGNKKIVLEQGYYNANGVTEVVPRNIYYIDDINQATSSSTNDVTITGRDLYKPLSTTVSRYSFNYFGPIFYLDDFDGTTLGNWSQQSGSWVEQNGTMTLSSSPGSSDADIVLGNIQSVTNASSLMVSIAYQSSGNSYVYGMFLDSNNWIRLNVAWGGGSIATCSVEQNIAGTITSLGSASQLLSAASGSFNAYVRQYDFYKFQFAFSDNNGGNSLAGINSIGFIPNSAGGVEFDITSFFTGVESTNTYGPQSQVTTVGLGCNNNISAFSNFQYNQYNVSNNVADLVNKLAAKAGVFSPNNQQLLNEYFFDPTQYTPNATLNTVNRVLEVVGTPSSQTLVMNNGTQVVSGEIDFRAQVMQNPGTTPTTSNPLGFSFLFNADAPNTGYSNAYRLMVKQVVEDGVYYDSGSCITYIERYYSGSWYAFPSTPGFYQMAGSINFDITVPHDYKLVFSDGWIYAFIDGVMVNACNDNNTTTNTFLTTGYFGWMANQNVTVNIYKANIPAFWKQNQSFTINPGDDMMDDMVQLLQSISAWFFSSILGVLKTVFLNSTDANTYTYQNAISTQGVDSSDKEYISQVTVYGINGVSATARNTTLMAGVATREEVIVDYTIQTQQDAQTRANNELINANQYKSQYSPTQPMNVGSELYDPVTIIDTGNNTTGVNSITRIYAQKFNNSGGGTGGGGGSNSYDIEIQTGNM